MAVSDEKLKQISELLEVCSEEEICRKFTIKEDTLRRYKLELKKRDLVKEPTKDEVVDAAGNKGAYLKQILDLYSDNELKAIAQGGRIIPGIENVPIVSFEGTTIRFGAISDTHIGHTRFDESRLMQAYEEFAKKDIEFIVHCGDVTEGMSNHPGQIYELSHIGYDRQKDEAIRLFGQWKDTPIYAVSGNHDRWYMKSCGANIVKDIDNELENFHFIGHDEGDISLNGRATLKLWHGEDSNSYALSYRLQKIIESFSGGEKPSVMLCGHTHKYAKIFERNVHAVSVGCLQSQSAWMRSKRIAAHVGFAIFEIVVNDEGIAQITETWYPFYA
jgi:predicted phosphodiesterase